MDLSRDLILLPDFSISYILVVNAFSKQSYTTTGRDENLLGPNEMRTYVPGFWTPWAHEISRHNDISCVAFDHSDSLGDPNDDISMLNSPDHTHHCRHFAYPLARIPVRLVEVCNWLHLHTTGLSFAAFHQLAWRSTNHCHGAWYDYSTKT